MDFIFFCHFFLTDRNTVQPPELLSGPRRVSSERDSLKNRVKSAAALDRKVSTKRNQFVSIQQQLVQWASATVRSCWKLTKKSHLHMKDFGFFWKFYSFDVWTSKGQRSNKTDFLLIFRFRRVCIHHFCRCESEECKTRNQTRACAAKTPQKYGFFLSFWTHKPNQLNLTFNTVWIQMRSSAEILTL